MVRIAFFAAALIFAYTAGPGAGPQDAKTEYDLTWKLPHDRAAVYDVMDATKKKIGEFCLLGCELGKPLAVTQGRELGYRYIFPVPKDKVKLGQKWNMKERVFNTNVNEVIPTLDIRGAYTVRQVKKARLDEILKWMPKGTKLDPTDMVIVEGQFEVYRCHWGDKLTCDADKNYSATLATTTIWRVSDNAIVGGRFQWHGRLDKYKGITDAISAQTDEGEELVLRDRLLDLTPAGLKERIDRAIAQGVNWLKGKQQKAGSWCDQIPYPGGTVQAAGSSALVLQAMVHAGLGREDAIAKNAYAYIAGANSPQSYDMGLNLMALEAKYLPLKTLEDVKSFSEEKAREQMAKSLTKPDKALAEALTHRLMDLQTASGGFGYDSSKAGEQGEINLSNTQYSLLGLKSASRLGVAIPGSVWKRALSYIESGAKFTDPVLTWEVMRFDGSKIERKNDAFGWPYVPRSPDIGWNGQITGTMTTAALTGLAICRSELARREDWNSDLEKKFDKLESGAIAWLQKNYSVRAASPEGANRWAAMPYFYLYSLERANILAGIEKIGGHDWYLEGAVILLSWQKQDGSWEGPHCTPVIDTAFALLFLKRATVPVETPSGDGKK